MQTQFHIVMQMQFTEKWIKEILKEIKSETKGFLFGG